MNPRVKNVNPKQDFTLEIQFSNNEIKIFDMKPYLNIGIFRELNNYNKFRQVKPFLNSIQWSGGQDLCPDTLYLESK
jgi:hypothetical protein